MKTTCFQAKQIGNMVHRIDVKFQVTPTSCTSQLSLGVIITIISYVYINYLCLNAVYFRFLTTELLFNIKKKCL